MIHPRQTTRAPAAVGAATITAAAAVLLWPKLVWFAPIATAFVAWLASSADRTHNARLDYQRATADTRNRLLDTETNPSPSTDEALCMVCAGRGDDGGDPVAVECEHCNGTGFDTDA